MQLADFEFDGLRSFVARAIFGSEGVHRVFFGGDLHATRVRRPDGVRLRLQSHCFGVRYAVAELSGFAAGEDAWIGIESLNGELFATELVERGAIAFVLLLRPLLRGLAINLAVLLPAGK